MTISCTEGLWDFPSRVLNPEEPHDQEYRKELFRQLLDDLIGLSQQDNCKTDISHLGTATHTFSHIQQTMIIDHMTLKVHGAPGTRLLFAC